MSDFKDHFSRHAELYRRFRPHLPAEVFAWLASLTPRRQLAWDAGTGNGQAAVLLAAHFMTVVASDASAEQIAQATPHPRVAYFVGRAEASGLGPGMIDLAMSAQALHWFDHDAYFAEVRRVVHPGGVVAALTYLHPELGGDDGAGPALTELLWQYIAHVRADWPPERGFVDAAYANIPFPFDEVPFPNDQALTLDLDLEGFYGYLATWSAAQRYRERTGEDPRAAWREPLLAAWGDPARARPVRWPLAGRVGRVVA